MTVDEPEMVWDPAGHFVADLNFGARADGDEFLGSMAVVPEICSPGTDHVRVGTLVTLADCVAGPLAAKVTMPSLSMTVDLTYVALARPPADVVHARAALRKVGRTTVFTETVLTDAAGEHFGLCFGTFVSSPRPQDVLLHDPTVDRIRPTGTPMFEEPLVDRMGIELLSPGVAEVHRHPKVLNPGQTLQGGAVAILAEVAAASAAADEVGAPMVVTDLDVRYLTGYRVGPGRATAEPLAVGGDGAPTTVRVEVRDVGLDDRLGTIALAKCLPAARFSVR
jgi:acyl-coenzyme A thioesterase PaaI-like protein